MDRPICHCCPRSLTNASAENDRYIAEANRIAQEHKEANQLPEWVFCVKRLNRDEFEIARHAPPPMDLHPCSPTVEIALEILASRGFYTTPELAVRAYKAKVAAQLDALLSKETKDGTAI